MELDDQIINYFKLNNKEDPSYINNIYSNKSIYLVGYPRDNHVVVSYGKPPIIDEGNKSKTYHYCSTEEGSSGSPILLIKNQKLIGIHYGSINQFGYNNGTLLIYSIIEFANIKNNLLLSDSSITEIYKNNIINSINNLNINSFSDKIDNTNNIILIDKDLENNKDNENYETFGCNICKQKLSSEDCLISHSSLYHQSNISSPIMSHSLNLNNSFIINKLSPFLVSIISNNVSFIKFK